MASARLFLNEKTVKKDGKTAVYALVHLENKSIKINTGVSVALDRFDKAKGRVKGTDKDAKLGHMKFTMVLQGDYRNIRQFIYELESAPNFLIIDDLTITEKSGGDAPTLTITMSTYFRDKGNADAR